MRLINEEVLMKDIQNTITEKSSTIDWMNLIYRQPTAYDVDKVVEQLEELKTINVDISFGTIIRTLRKDVVLEIVKGGGVDE